MLLQLPIAKLSQGRRRMPTLALLGLLWSVALALVPLAGLWVTAAAATALLAFAMSIFAIGECLHGAVQAPLVTDLADKRLLGRYMALSALSWQLGFTLGPALGGFMLALSPTGLWLGAAAICGLAGLAALPLERTLPYAARRTPRPGGVQATGVESRTMAMTIDDPLSPHAEPAPHPTHAAAQRGGRSTPSS